jgi:transposase-like protein
MPSMCSVSSSESVELNLPRFRGRPTCERIGGQRVPQAKKFEPEFKAEAIHLALEEGALGHVGDWVKQAEIDRGQGPPGCDGCGRKHRELKMEREIQERAAAFFAKESS